ncbi:MAG: sugar transferase [Flavobacteriaceae bacterium]|jgi:exopolysaccharide biosynthesis polyprenyl glycosylphosphotransferase|nr:sugar transferase [Flavobacteriaceae bacterium]|tara:strand:- start:53687 stop:55072 length:1386 start_codon:yes stop_codon:yes gene_type:complete
MTQKGGIHFEISERKILLRIFDIVSVLALLYAIGEVFDFDYFKINAQHWVWSIVLAVYLTVFATIFELYDLQKASKLDIVVQNIILTASVTVLFYLLTPFYTPTLPENRLQIVYFFLAINVALFLWRYAYITFISAPRFFKHIMLIGNSEEIESVVTSLEKSDPNYRVIGYVNTGNKPYQTQKLIEFDNESLSETIKKHAISEIVVALSKSEEMTIPLNNQLIRLLEKGMPIKEYTHVYEDLNRKVPVQFIADDFYRYFPFSRSNQNKLYLFFHRLMDLIISVIGLLFGVLIFPFIVIGNVLANKGPLFYKQERVGKNGEHFKIVKLRSMVTDAEKDGAQYAKKKDTRVTYFGNFLRRTRIDEIPQFINVIKGEMSVIGPRPERPIFVESLSEQIPFYEIRHLVKPGVTGWAQVNAKYGMTQEDAMEKLQYDLYYIKRRSFFLDTKIILKTLSTIIFFRGQ